MDDTTRMRRAGADGIDGADGTREWGGRQLLTLGVVLLGMLTLSMSMSGTTVALTGIGAELGASGPALQWVVTGYFLTASSFMLLFGSLGDLVGRRRTYRTGAVLFALGLGLGALAPGIGLLDAARALAGLGAAGVMAGGGALLASAFRGAARTKAFAALGTTGGVGLALGPTLTGALVGSVGWRVAFGLFAAVGLLVAAGAGAADETRTGGAPPGEARPGGARPGGAQPGGVRPGRARPGGARPGGARPGRARPGGARPGRAQLGGAQLGGRTKPNGAQTAGRTKLDGAGAALFVLGLGLLMAGVTQGPANGWTSPPVLAALAAGPALLAAFAVRQSRTARPLLDLTLVRDRHYLAWTVAGLSAAVGFAGSLTHLPTYFQGVDGLSAGRAGAAMLWLTAPVLVAPLLGGRLLTRGVPARAVITGALALVAGGNAWLTVLEPGAGTARLAGPLLAVGIGTGLANGIVDGQAMNRVGTDRAGMAAGFLNTVRGGGQAMVIAALGAALLTLVSSRVGSAQVAAEVVSGHLAGGERAFLAAQFTSAWHTVLWAVAALVTLALAAVATLLRPDHRPGSGLGTNPDSDTGVRPAPTHRPKAAQGAN
ncbi:MFS transporter [Kitasatospora phosalacinea]|uniref:MFS transporter n=1 Tax=Kitasatospora phosalacinea TaxID=2065 RepID=UPI0035DA9984